MVWTAITSGQTDADSPVDQALLDKIRTNDADHETRLVALGVDLTLTGSAASPPDSNTLVKENIVKGWCHVTYSAGTPTLADSYNVSGIVDTAVGQLAVQWNRDLANATYATTVTSQSASSGDVDHVGIDPDGGQTTADVDILNIRRSDGADVDPAYINITAIGDQ